MNHSESKNNEKIQILIAEDSATQAEQLRHILEQHGFRVIAASNGKEALAAAREHQPAIIISDIVMPEMDGYELCRRVRSDNVLRETPVVLLTSLSSPKDVIEALKSGADNFIRKPYNESHLLLRLNHIVMNRKLRVSDKVKIGIELYLGGSKHFITAERQQILDLLISTYEQAVQLCADLKKHEQEVERANAILGGIYRIAKDLNRARSKQDIVDAVLKQALTLPDIFAAWMFLREEGAEFRLVGSRGLPPALDKPEAMEGDCLCRRRILAGELRGAAHIYECERLAHAEGETFGLKSHVTVPIWSGDTIIGGLNLLCKEGFSYGDDDLRVLNGIGNQIGVALARCRMQEHLEDLVRERTAALTAEIVERKRIEEVLRENEERYRLMFDANPLPLWVFDRETNKFLAVNNAAVEHYGFSREEFLLMTVADICPKGEVARLKEDLAREPAARRAIRKHKKKDGTLIDVEILAHDILFSGRKARIVLANDITGQLKAQAEKKILEAQFLQAQKMESLGALAGGIAHDFNNILGIILGHASLLQRAMERPETIPSSVDAITKTVARGAGLVRQLLTFSRKSEISVELVRPNDVIDELARMITATFPKSITLGLDLKKDLPAIYADPNQLYQALLNLTINSRDAMPQGGALRLTTDQAPGSTVRQRFSDARHDRYVTITVSDTGEGMDEETQRRAFEPFYTTKSIGKGTGLGMSVVYGVVTAHDGKVFLQSARGKGTTFTLYFPVQEKPEIAKVERRSLGEEIPGGSETLLVVEDEAMLRELVSALLSSKGYNVITAEDGVAAIEQYEAHKNEIALVISDIGLPKLDGVELMKRLRQRDQGVKFVIATGYIDTGIREQMSGMHVQEVIQKPYRPDELLRKVRKVIDLKR